MTATEKPKTAPWLGYGPAEHVEWFHAIPRTVTALLNAERWAWLRHVARAATSLDMAAQQKRPLILRLAGSQHAGLRGRAGSAAGRGVEHRARKCFDVRRAPQKTAEPLLRLQETAS
jgi:hypothetical protein